MSVDITAPLDELHQQCIEARAAIRADIERARRSIASWEPRPRPGRDVRPVAA